MSHREMPQQPAKQSPKTCRRDWGCISLERGWIIHERRIKDYTQEELCTADVFLLVKCVFKRWYVWFAKIVGLAREQILFICLALLSLPAKK